MERIDTRSLYESQRNKLTEDIGKFIANKVKLQKTFPPGFKVRRYCFVVPEFRSQELVAHAQRKTREVREAQLEYAENDFTIVVQTKENFEAEQRLEILKLLKDLKVEIDEEVEQERVDAWVADNDAGVQNLNRKIPLFTTFTSEKEIERERRYWIERKICTDNALYKLRTHAPDAWEKLWAVRVGRERLLGREYRRVGMGTATVESISDKLAADMIDQVPNLPNLSAEALAEGLVGEWLQNCKLNFPEPCGT